jgi:hypothetical protein
MNEPGRLSEQTEPHWVECILESLEDTGLHQDDVTGIFLKAMMEHCIRNKVSHHKFNKIIDDLKLDYQKITEDKKE